MIYDALNQSPTGLRTTGLVIGLAVCLAYAAAAARPDPVIRGLRALPFHLWSGRLLMALAGAWAFFLFRGLDPVGIPRMDMGEFYHLRPYLLTLIPVLTLLVIWHCGEFLAVRAIGCLILLAAAIPLDAAFLREPASRLFLVVPVYLAVLKALFWIGMPYLLRDQVGWLTADTARFRILNAAGAGYGLIIAVAALLWW